MSDTMKKKVYKFSEERRKQISESAKGRVFSKEHREKLGKAILGDKNPMKSQATRDKHSELRAKEWIVTHPCGKVEKIVNMNKFCKDRGLNQSNMHKVVSGSKRSYKGFIIVKA